ncbi:MAG: hypothetical protein ACR5LC_03040 [Symbiopectobacterium sp.]|uniref:hypothetical protein n=1 Tax=Symbiopectobacterium sp. TaxID=2952789 RepID=UPI003F4185B5
MRQVALAGISARSAYPTKAVSARNSRLLYRPVAAFPFGDIQIFIGGSKELVHMLRQVYR